MYYKCVSVINLSEREKKQIEKLVLKVSNYHFSCRAPYEERRELGHEAVVLNYICEREFRSLLKKKKIKKKRL